MYMQCSNIQYVFGRRYILVSPQTHDSQREYSGNLEWDGLGKKKHSKQWWTALYFHYSYVMIQCKRVNEGKMREIVPEKERKEDKVSLETEQLNLEVWEIFLNSERGRLWRFL